MFPPARIVCLTEETVETLYLLGEQDRIVGVSGYVVRPPEARRDKPRVSAFTSADTEKILALNPDLVFTFSDLQADIVADLLRRGLTVHAFNHRTIGGILDMIRTVGALVGAFDRADALARRYEARLETTRAEAAARSVRPRVFFEEWDEPLISCIGWVLRAGRISSSAPGAARSSGPKKSPPGRDFQTFRRSSTEGCTRSNPRSFSSRGPPP
jgi:iron complex transport system substrate-binding protein